MRWIRLRSGSFLEWYEYGDKSSDTAVVMLHGINSTGRLWEFVDDYAKTQGFRVISPSLPGWGLSGGNATGTPMEWAENDMKELLLHHLRLNKLYIFGASMGSVYAAALANALRENVVEALMLYVAFAPKSERHEPLKGSMLWSFQRIHQRFPTVMRLLDKYLFVPILSRVAPDGRHTFRQWEGLWKGREVIFQPWGFSLQDLPCPPCTAIVVSGTGDVLAPCENQRILHESIPGSKLVKYEGSHEHSLLNPETLYTHLNMLLHSHS